MLRLSLDRALEMDAPGANPKDSHRDRGACECNRFGSTLPNPIPQPTRGGSFRRFLSP